jgi:hypothetical protein
LQEKQGYPESRKILNYEMSLVYGKSPRWSSIKMQHIKSSIKIQHNDHQFKIKSSITSQKHISKFNFALVTIRYDMEKPFFNIISRGSKVIGKVNNILWLWLLDARKSSQVGIDMSTFYSTKESLVKFFYFHKKNIFITIFNLHLLMDQLSNPLDITSTNNHITQI